MSHGFTLIEVVVAISIFAFLVLGVFGLYSEITNGISLFKERMVISALARERMEAARNTPYSDLGTISGNPHGELPDFFSPENISINNTGYQAYFSVAYVDDPADGTILQGTDFSPNDYKQVKLYIKNANTGKTSSFFTSFAPNGLENAVGGGAISIEVFDALGQPVSGASIHIENSSVSPAINLSRISDANGKWVEVSLPASANSYRITVAKSGYSSDQTHAITAQNPSPTKPDSTVADGQATQVSFSIDRLGSLVFNVKGQDCSLLPGEEIKISGSKLIGTPDVLKFSSEYFSDDSGQIALDNVEWDNYTAVPMGSDLMVCGFSPVPQSLLPGASLEQSIILGPNTQNSLLVIVKNDSGVPLDGADVALQLNLQNAGQGETGGSELCPLPGQAFFSGLESGDNYSVTASLQGYQPKTIDGFKIDGHEIIEISLSQ